MDGNQLDSLMRAFDDATQTFSPQDVLLTILLSFLLTMVIAGTYRSTHRGASYSQTFAQTLIILAMVVGVVMLIVGSNIARAFTLVGALSIVRFRNAVKETRDVGFIFFAMAIGMACGTRFYLLAVIATVTICLLIWIMTTQNMFAKELTEQILKIRLPADIPYDEIFDDVFAKYLTRVDLLAVETVQAGMLTELVYGVEFRKKRGAHSLIADLRKLNQNNKVVLVTGAQDVDL